MALHISVSIFFLLQPCDSLSFNNSSIPFPPMSYNICFSFYMRAIIVIFSDFDRLYSIYHNIYLYFSMRVIIIILSAFNILFSISHLYCEISSLVFVLFLIQDFLISCMVKMQSLLIKFPTSRNPLDIHSLLIQVLSLFTTNGFHICKILPQLSNNDTEI